MPRPSGFWKGGAFDVLASQVIGVFDFISFWLVKIDGTDSYGASESPQTLGQE